MTVAVASTRASVGGPPASTSGTSAEGNVGMANNVNVRGGVVSHQGDRRGAVAGPADGATADFVSGARVNRSTNADACAGMPSDPGSSAGVIGSPDSRIGLVANHRTRRTGAPNSSGEQAIIASNPTTCTTAPTSATASAVENALLAAFSTLQRELVDLRGVVREMQEAQSLQTLPLDLRGVILGTTSEAILVTLIVVRDAALGLTRCGGVSGLPSLAVYAADQTHSTFFKAFRLAGFDPANVRSIPTGPETDYALDPDRLHRFMQADVDAGLVPTYVCATIGTTSTNAVDPIGDIALVAAKFNAWVHVDVAYAGSACICPEFRHHLDGVELVDSISMSPHKWLLTCLDCTCLWVRDTHRLTDSLETNPEYLKNDASESSAVADLKDMQIGIGRRFRGLKLWMVMRTYGAAKLQQHIRSDVAMAKLDVRGPGPCRRQVRGRRSEAVRARLLPDEAARRHGRGGRRRGQPRAHGAPEQGRQGVPGAHGVGGRFVLRFAVGSTLQEERHVRSAWELITKTATEIIKGQKHDDVLAQN